jgi:hypothetical protein
MKRSPRHWDRLLAVVEAGTEAAALNILSSECVLASGSKADEGF